MIVLDPMLGGPEAELLNAVSAAAPVGSDVAQFLAVALQRGLNQVVYGLDAALATI